MTAPVFVDTNVFVYASQCSELAKQPLAKQWLERLWNERAGRTSMQVLNEYYWNLTRKGNPKLAPEDAWDLVHTLFEWNPQPIDAAVLARAREIERRYRLSWWDSLIVGAAQAQNCTLLLTEDLQDRGVYGGVTVRNPFVLGVSEPTAEYAVLPVTIFAHRYRGRAQLPEREKAA